MTPIHETTDNWTPDYTPNRFASIEKIGQMVQEAFDAFHDEEDLDNETLRDHLFSLLEYIYPGASRVVPHEFSVAAKIQAGMCAAVMNQADSAVQRFRDMSPQLQEKYKINRNVCLEELGELVNDCMDYLCDEDTANEDTLDCVRDAIYTMSQKLFPDTWTVETARSRVNRYITEAIVLLKKEDIKNDDLTFLLREARETLKDVPV